MPNDPTDLWYDPTIDLDKLTPAERRQLGPVGIHREFITAAARWIMEAKL
jgi:hypothetical protein